jgi:DNA-binding LacI/PurR family transcriptional regulator
LVRQAIESLGYYPNTHARSLGSGKSHMYGLIISDISNPFFPNIAKSFERLAVAHGQELLIANTDDQPLRMEECVRRMVERKVDGVAIMTSEMPPKLVKVLNRHNIPMVLLDAKHKGPNVSNIFVDYTRGIDQAVEHLISLGHESFAFVSGAPHVSSTQTRRSVFLHSLRKRGISCCADAVYAGHGRQATVDALLCSRPPPTAVMASSDLTAISVMRQIHASGLRVPKDISVIGIDDIEVGAFIQPSLSTIRVSRHEIALSAFTALRTASQKRITNATSYRISTESIIRESTGPAKG